MAMMSSGMNGQSFAFNGYLPIDKAERKAEIKRLERLSLNKINLNYLLKHRIETIKC